MALQIKAVTLVQGAKEFNIKAVTLLLSGPTPNNTPPLITPQAAGGGAIIGSNIIIKQPRKPA